MARPNDSPRWTRVAVLVICLCISIGGWTGGPVAGETGTALNGHTAVAGTSDHADRPETEPPGNVSLTNFSGPAQIQPGDPFTVAVTLVNSDSTRTVERVHYSVGGHVIDAKWLTIAAGATKTVTFNVTAPDTRGFPDGTYSHGVFTPTAQSVAPLTIATSSAATTVTDASISTRTADSPSFRVSAITVPQSVSSGKPLTVTATVTNPKPTQRTEDVELRLNGTVIDHKQITLGPNEETAVVFRVGPHTLEPHAAVIAVFTRDFGAVANVSVTAPNETTTSADFSPSVGFV